MERSGSPADPVRPELSVVLACPDGDDPDAALRALRRGTRGAATEVLVARPDGRAPEAEPGVRGDVRPVEGPPDALVPELWGAGLQAARGGVVAFTTSRFRVSEGWAASLLEALAGGAAGAGGPVLLARGAGPVARAVHLLRYSDFAGPRPAGPVREVPGDNAAYRRRALVRDGGGFADGFWDVEVHRRLRARGEELVWVPEAETRLVGTEGLVSFLRQRFRHGARFGRYRARELGTPVWRILAAAPLVPAVMAGRALARRWREAAVGSLGAVPCLLLAASAWAAGEARGAWGAGRSDDGKAEADRRSGSGSVA